MDVNAVLTKLGRWGPWQRRAFILISLSGNLVLSMNTLIIVFIGNTPSYYCKSVNNSSNAPVFENQEAGQNDECRVFRNDTNSTAQCTGGWYYETNGRPTIVTEWDLVCDKDYYVDLSQTVFMVSLLLSDFFISTLADYFGRKRVHIMSAFLSGICGIVLALVPNFTAFVVVRFIMGLFVDGTFCTSLVYLVEHFAVHNRMVATCLNLFFWPCGIWLLDLLAYLIPHWRHLTAVIGIIHMLPILYLWLLDESLPWLEAKHRLEDFSRVLKHAAQLNHVQLDQSDFPTKIHVLSEATVEAKPGVTDEPASDSDNAHEDELLQEKQNGHGRLTPVKAEEVGIIHTGSGKINKGRHHEDNIISVLCHPRLFLFTIVLSLIWLTSNVSYYGISLGAGDLAGSLYVNIFIFGSMDFTANIGIFISSKWFGRRPPIIIGFLMVGVCLIVKEFIPVTKENESTMYPILITIIMIGYCGTAAAFADICIYTPELFPTRVRNLAYGITMAFGRIGGILAPMYSYASGSVSWVPALIVGSAAIFTGLATFSLPETRRRPLFQTIRDMDEWREQKRQEKKLRIQ